MADEDKQNEEETEAEEATEDETSDADDFDGDDEEAEDEDSEDDSDDDDESDEDASDDEDEDDDESDDEEDDEPEPVKAKVRKKTPSRKKTGRKKRGPKTTAGQRLAAAKAAKAAKKAAQRGKQAEIVEDKATERAEMAAGWFEENRSKMMMGVAAVALLLVGAFAYNAYSSKQNVAASSMLWDATQTLNAVIESADEEPATDEEEDDAESYETLEARADAALEKLDALIDEHGSSDLVPYAQLLRGRALSQKGQPAEARTAYETALSTGDENVRPRALEGIAFTYEAEESWDEAVARFEELRETDELELLADYHLARIHLAQDQETEAKDKLQTILSAFQSEEPPELPFVRDQAELRMMAIDSSLVQRDATPDQEELRRLIQQQLQQQQQGG
ncbi:MAG: tetratricopeptide repeat protein [Myxococcota bacterium]